MVLTILLQIYSLLRDNKNRYQNSEKLCQNVYVEDLDEQMKKNPL